MVYLYSHLSLPFFLSLFFLLFFCFFDSLMPIFATKLLRDISTRIQLRARALERFLARDLAAPMQLSPHPPSHHPR
jgi:hypothetical protein